MPSTPVYPKSNTVIKASKRNYNAVLAAVQAVNQTKATVIAAMGGVVVLAGAIWTAICALPGQLCTIFSVMMQVRQKLLTGGSQFLETYDAAAYQIISKLA